MRSKTTLGIALRRSSGSARNEPRSGPTHPEDYRSEGQADRRQRRQSEDTLTTPGPLLEADEGLNHQIVDTFARVGQSDRSWTEKIWAMAASRDGSLSVAFGLGKYVNRNVMDGFAGVSRGTRAVDRALQPSAVTGIREQQRRTDRLQHRRAVATDSIPAGRDRHRPDQLRRRDRGSGATGHGGTRNPHQPKSCSDRRRHHALPSERGGTGMGRGGRHAHRDRRPTLGGCPRPFVGRSLRRRSSSR